MGFQILLKAKFMGIQISLLFVGCVGNQMKQYHIIYHHLESKDLLASKQKECYCGSRGTKDQLLVDKLVLTEAYKRDKNLNMTWLNFCNAFDSVPHDWILKCLLLYGMHPKICGVIASSMQFWRTTLTCNNVVLGDMNICRGICQGDSLSSLPFVLALMPISYLLCQTNKGYTVKDCDVRLNHLLYVDDIKLYGRSQSELESLAHIVQLYSEDICMLFGLAKCRTVVRGKLCSSEGLRSQTTTPFVLFLMEKLTVTWQL